MPCLIILLKSNPCPLRNWMEPACTFPCVMVVEQCRLPAFCFQAQLWRQAISVKEEAIDPAFCMNK